MTTATVTVDPEPGQYDFEGVVGGSCFPFELIAEDSSGNVLDLAGYASSFLEITWRGGILDLTLTLTAAQGKSAGELSGTQTSSFPIGRLTHFKWHITEPSGCRKTWLVGYFVREA